MSDRLLAATRKGLFFIERGANARWAIRNVAFLGDNVSMVLPDTRDGTTYAALDHGHFGVKLHRSANANDWEACGVPAYPPKPEGVDDVNPMSQKPIPWSLSLIWSLETGGPREPGALWCGTIPGGLFRSDDRGTTWKLVESLWNHPGRKQWFGGGRDLPGIHSICVDPRDSKRLLLGVSCGGVWETLDQGESWQVRASGMRAEYMPPEMQHEPNIQDPHRLVQCPAQPDQLWVQHHNGIFRSTDNSASWQELAGVAPAVFGFPVAVHPRDGNTAWFVPATKDEKRFPVDGKVVVTRTRDGGKSFETLTRGLPQEHAYDIVYRHCMDIDVSGDRLAFGSTTGSLWITENQGDAWTTVSNHLPPIYCVRFVK